MQNQKKTSQMSPESQITYSQSNQKEAGKGFHQEDTIVYYLISKQWIKQWKQYCKTVEKQRKKMSQMNEDLFERGEVKKNVTLDNIEIINQDIFNKCFATYPGYKLRRIARKEQSKKIISIQAYPISILILKTQTLDEIMDKTIKKQDFKPIIISSLSFQHTLDDLRKQIERVYIDKKKNEAFKLWRTGERLEETYLSILRQSGHSKKNYYSLDGLGKQVPKHNCEKISLLDLRMDQNQYFIVEVAQAQKWFFTKDGEARCGGCFQIKKLMKDCPCRKVSYCDDICQLKDKPFHKKYCIFSQKDEENQKFLDMTKKKNSKNGLVGLKNTGNTCYMNSVLQCLSHTDSLRQYFLTNKYINDLRLNLNKSFKVVKSFATFIQKSWCQQNDIIAPFELKEAMTGINQMYAGNIQHDAHEFLINLIESLNSGLNRHETEKKGSKKDRFKGEKIDIKKIAEDDWIKQSFKEQSVITENMKGQTISRLICPNCRDQSFRAQNFLALSLPIPEQKVPKKLSYTVIFNNFEEIPLNTFHVYKESIPSKWIRSAATALNKRSQFFKMYFLTQNGQIEDIEKKDISDTLYKLNYQQQKLFLIELSLLDVKIQQRVEICVKFVGEKNRGKGLWFKYPFFFQKNETSGEDIYKKILRFLYAACYTKSQHNLKYLYNRVPVFYEEYQAFMLKNRPFKLFFKTQKKVKKQMNSSKVSFENQIQFSFKSQLTNLLQDSDPSKCEIQVVFKESYLNKNQDYFDFQNLKKVREGKKFINSQKLFDEEKIEINLQECFKEFQCSEELGIDNKWICSSCQTQQQAIKSIKIFKTPQTLILHLKRFRIAKKIKFKVNFPQILDLSQFVIDQTPMKTYISVLHKKRILKKKFDIDQKQLDVTSKPIYQLYAICNHYGGMEGGHYTAFAKNGPLWYKFNDNKVQQVNIQDVQTSAAYMLFYKRIRDQ